MRATTIDNGKHRGWAWPQWWVVVGMYLGMVLLCHGASPEKLRVVTWNLKWFPGGSPRAVEEKQAEHIREVQEQLKNLKPDVLILQEVRDPVALEKTLQPLDPRWKVAIVSRIKAGNALSNQQIAIAAKMDAVAAWAEPWAGGRSQPPRGYAYAVFEVSGKKLAFYGLHLKSNLGDSVKNTMQREEAIEQLLGHLQAPTKQVIAADAYVIAGDFNTDESGLSLRDSSARERTLPMFVEHGFHWAFEGVAHKDRITCPGKGRYPDACFDHIFTKGWGKPVAFPTATKASDHLPVVVDLVVPK